MSGKVIRVFTGKSVAQMRDIGGSGHWKLNTKRASECDYIVMYRNRRREGASTDAAHGDAFAIGRIESIAPSPGRFERWIVCFESYADLTGADPWPGDRNPVGYESGPEELGIDVSRLEWKPFHLSGEVDPGATGQARSSSAGPLTIAEAKRGLALHFGVDETAIEVIIRG